MTRSFERFARRESILKYNFKMFNPETIDTEHSSFSFCLPAKNYSSKLSQVLYVASVFCNFTFQQMPCLQVFSSFTFCSTCLMLKFLVWRHSQVLLHTITKHCIHSPASTGVFLENRTNCWVNTSLCCSAHLCTQAGIGPTEINRHQFPSSFGNHTSAMPGMVIKICSCFFLDRNWFWNSLGPATQNKCTFTCSWAQPSFVDAALAAPLGCSRQSEVEHELQLEFHIKTFLCFHLTSLLVTTHCSTAAYYRNVQLCVIPRNFPWAVYICKIRWHELLHRIWPFHKGHVQGLLLVGHRHPWDL